VYERGEEEAVAGITGLENPGRAEITFYFAIKKDMSPFQERSIISL
jgi:hypothetical protein